MCSIAKTLTCCKKKVSKGLLYEQRSIFPINNDLFISAVKSVDPNTVNQYYYRWKLFNGLH